MAVVTDDIALQGFVEDGFGGSTPRLRDVERFFEWAPMIELHHIRRKAKSTVATWSVAEGEQQVSLRKGAPLHRETPLSLQNVTFGAPFRRPSRLQGIGPDGVAIRANDVAFRHFSEQSVALHEHGSRGRHVERLGSWVPMVEIHLVRFKPAAAVLTGNPAKLSEEFERGALPRHHPIDLALAITAVVADVVGTLIARAGHVAEDEQAFESRQ
jgi:hypothetical protein